MMKYTKATQWHNQGRLIQWAQAPKPQGPPNSPYVIFHLNFIVIGT